MTSDTILDSLLYIRLDLDHSDKANGQFRTDATKKAHLASQLLLYDRVVLPTKDFGIIPILIDWLGTDGLVEALEQSVLGFAHLPSIMGYAGNGNGIGMFAVHGSDKLRFQWWQDAMFGPMEEAPELQMKHKCPFIDSQERSRLVQNILSSSKEINGENELFMKAIAHESYSDIIADAGLSSFVLLHEPPGATSAKLPRLTGVNPNQIRVLSLKHIRDGIDVVLRVADINLGILVAQIYGQCDIGTSEGAERLLASKLSRSGIKPSLASKFVSLHELSEVPDIRLAVSSGSASVGDILTLRNTRASKEFRKWLRNAEAQDGRELERLYVRTLAGSSLSRSLPFRILRFALTTAAGLIPFVGPLVSVVDSFFVDKWIHGYSPKLFLDQLGRLPN